MTCAIKQWVRAAPVRGDLVVALCCLVVSIPLTLAGGYLQNRSIPASLALLVLSCLPLTVRSRWPYPVVVATVLADAAILLVFPGPPPTAAVFAVYAVAVGTDRRTAWRVGGAAAAVLAVASLVSLFNLQALPLHLSNIAWICLATATGDAVRSRRQLLASITERAERAERTKEEEASRRVTEERIRIARELHDVVAHHITLINAQAGMGHHLMPTDPERAYQALERIRDTSRSALDELRATVGLLRNSDHDDQDSPREPAPGLADLGALLDSFRHTGLLVLLDSSAPAPQLSPITDLAAYRIIQEALTNTHKHAATSTARVRLRASESLLHLTVTDDGRPATTPGEGNGHGHGMIGMQERARSAGGSLTAGPVPAGGFRVHAELPLRTG